MSNRNVAKDTLRITGIVLLVLLLVILFLLTMGSILPGDDKKSVTVKYDDIDFNKVYLNIEQAIEEKSKQLLSLEEQKKQIEKIVRLAIILIKILLCSIWVGFNIFIAYIKGTQYDINQFILWNQAILIIVLFTLFMISEKFSNIHTAFSALKEYINKIVLKKYGIDSQLMLNYSLQIHMLESI